jgi:hypothetical protein
LAPDAPIRLEQSSHISGKHAPNNDCAAAHSALAAAEESDMFRSDIFDFAVACSRKIRVGRSVSGNALLFNKLAQTFMPTSG